MKTEKGFFTGTFIAFILIPVVVLAVVPSIFAWTIREKNKKSKERLSCLQNHLDKQMGKIFRLAIAIVISFVSCMTPVIVIFLWNATEPPPFVHFKYLSPFFFPPLFGAFVEFSKSLHLFYLYQELPRLPWAMHSLQWLKPQCINTELKRWRL